MKPSVDSDDDKAPGAANGSSRSPVIPKHLQKVPPQTALSYARSEAILIGQLMTRPISTMALSRKRVSAINQITDSINRDAVREAERIEAVLRKQSQAEARVRAQRCRSAEARQAQAIAATGAFVARAALAPGDPQPALTGSAIDARAATPSPGASFGNSWWQQANDGLSTSWSSCFRPVSPISLADECFAPTHALTSSSSASAILPVRRPSGTLSPANDAQSEAFDTAPTSPPSLPVDAYNTSAYYDGPTWGGSRMCSPAFGATRSSLYSRESSDTQAAATILAVPASRRSRMEWQQDIGANRPLRPTLTVLTAPHARAQRATRESAATPSSFVSSLRSPNGDAAAQVPLLPRPCPNEAARAGYRDGGWAIDRQMVRQPTHERYFAPGERREERDQMRARGETQSADDVGTLPSEDHDGDEDIQLSGMFDEGAQSAESAPEAKSLAQRFLEKRLPDGAEVEPPPPPRPLRAMREDPILLPRRVAPRRGRGGR